MNLDMSFCSGLRCTRASTCERWFKNLQKWDEKHNMMHRLNHISMAQFADHDGNCEMYEHVEARAELEIR